MLSKNLSDSVSYAVRREFLLITQKVFNGNVGIETRTQKCPSAIIRGYFIKKLNRKIGRFYQCATDSW